MKSFDVSKAPNRKEGEKNKSDGISIGSVINQSNLKCRD